jgi:hypothetical protein
VGGGRVEGLWPGRGWERERSSGVWWVRWAGRLAGWQVGWAEIALLGRPQVRGVQLARTCEREEPSMHFRKSGRPVHCA